MDKRKKAQSPTSLQGHPIREGPRQNLINGFLKEGKSNHSGLHQTLSYIIEYCEENKIPYRLTAYPRQGYLIERIPALEY